MNAYELLSRPTLELTDNEVDLIIADLRKRRAAYLEGTADTPKKAAAAKPVKASVEEKQANTLSLLAKIGMLPKTQG